MASKDSAEPYQFPRHIQLLNNKLLDVAAGRTKRLLIFMPPRHGKSELVSKYFTAWYLLTHPEHRVILSSYGSDFASTWGRKARDVFAEHGPSLFGLQLRNDSTAADSWNIARHRGGMDTAGVGAAITGKGADLFIIDDPIKNWEESNSQTVRDSLWDWFTSTAYTRLSPNGRMIVVVTRWNFDDLPGRILKAMERGGEHWDVLSLPAIAESNDEMGRLPGEALWPDQFPLEKLLQIKDTLGHQFISMYQQRPAPSSGAIFKRPYFDRRYRELPQLDATVMAVDSAFKTGVGNDYSVIATWGKDAANYYAINVWRDRVEFPDLFRAIVDQYNRYKPRMVLIEDAASGQSVIQQLRRDTSIPIVAVKASGSKQSRADLISPLFESGKVLLPEYAPWIEDFIDEHITFPRGAHDDMVDTSSHALMRLAARAEASSMPSILDIESELPFRNIWDAESDVAIWG